jgi:Ca-activated chloride channel family protein
MLKQPTPPQVLCLLLGGLAAVAAVAAAPLPTGRTVTLTTSLGTPVMAAGRVQTAVLKVGLTGFDVPREGHTPVNLALVLDRSGSMGGGRMENAKEAALMVVDRLSPTDVLSVVAYDDVVEVLVPAAPAVEKEAIKARIRSLRPRGSTALFAGVSKGLEEVRRHAAPGRVNRVILLSDGQANVGPSSPNELGRLGLSAAKEGISVSTMGIGLGYNEDLMTQLASRSDGNHAFVERPEDLARVFGLELGDVLSVVVKDVVIKVSFAEGVRPLRLLNRDVDTDGSMAILTLNQLYAGQEKFFLFEVELPASGAGSSREVASVDVTYDNLVSRKPERVEGRARARFSDDVAAVRDSTDATVMVAASEAMGTRANRQAVVLRDQGKVEEARRVLDDNAGYLREQAQRYQAPKLLQLSRDNEVDAKNMDDGNWNSTRKKMRKRQYELDSQQSY